MEKIFNLIKIQISEFISSGYIDFIILLIIFIAFFLLATLNYYLIKKGLLPMIGFLIKKSKTSLDDMFWNKKFFVYIPHLTIALFSLGFTNNAFLTSEFSTIFSWLEKIATVYLSLIILFLISGFLQNMLTFYESLKLPDNFNLKGIFQAINVFLYILTIIFIIGIIIEKNPWSILSGIGALTAVLLLVFREPLLGFVSGIQIFANKMAKVGDWIQLTKHNVDGNILDISLTTIKIQNWDNTIVQLPSHTLTSESFKNWEGMKKSGGRRIKRPLYIDMKTIRFINQKELNGLKKNPVFYDYFSKKEKEVSQFEITMNRQVMRDEKKTKKKIFPTTLGVFREYTLHYLINHPLIHQQLILMVRGLPPTPKGLPMEIYCFTKTIEWVPYERIQSEIFEHLIAVAKGFHLRIFQDPTGNDFLTLKEKK